jgi:membrane fusion protein (multidrug efflux system)
MKRSRILISAVIVLVAAGATAFYFKTKDGNSAEASETGARIDSIARAPADGSSAETAFPSNVLIPVEGSPAIQDTMVIAVTAAGEAAAFRQTIVSALVAGELKQLGVRENAAVPAGALLALIDPAQFQLELSEAEAALRQAQAKYQAETMFDDRITDANARAQRQKAARANTGLETNELRVEKAKLNLSRSRSVAPFASRVASIKVVPGQWVTQGQELLTLVDISQIKLEVQVLESEVGLLTPGRFARVVFAAYPAEVFRGRIETINPIVDSKTRSAKVTVSLPNRDGRILPGMYARVSLDARQLPNRIMVPRAAILERDRRKMLFVFEGEGTSGLAKWRYVATGAENDMMVEIIESPDPEADGTKMVAPGEIVLIGGHHTLTHDARVRLISKAGDVR